MMQPTFTSVQERAPAELVEWDVLVVNGGLAGMRTATAICGRINIQTT